jgi:hypothetical protein
MMDANRRRRAVGVMVTICAGFVLWRVVWGDRTPRVDNDALTDLASIASVPQWPRQPLPSPDGRYVAHSDSVGEVEESIRVTDSRTGRTVRLVTVGEADPYSGRSHVLAWSRVSGALLILGSGSLGGRRPVPLCLVYRMSADDLIRPAQCPAWKANVVSE